MPSSDFVRWGGVAGMLAGILFVLLFVLGLVLPQPSPGSSADVLTSVAFILALLLLVAGLIGFHALQKETYGRVGRAGLYTVLVGATVQVVAQLILLTGSTVAEALDFIGLFGVLVGFVVYGTATVQAGVLPRWCGIGFITGLPVWLAISVVFGELGGIIGGILFGLLWLALGYTLFSRSDRVPQSAPRVR